jgi:hypothetical protein
MRSSHALLALVLVLAAAVARPAPVSAWSLAGCPGEGGKSRTLDAYTFCEQSWGILAIMDAYPPEALVALDDRPLGTVGDVLWRGLTVAPGWHVVKLSAPGFRAQASPVWVDAFGSPTLLRTRLVRD